MNSFEALLRELMDLQADLALAEAEASKAGAASERARTLAGRTLGRRDHIAKRIAVTEQALDIIVKRDEIRPEVIERWRATISEKASA